MKRHKTRYAGVFYREAKRIGGNGSERVFYIVFKKNGRVIEEKVGRQFADDMTPARAARIRSERIEGRRKSRKEIRKEKEAIRQTEADRWTIGRLFNVYMESRREGKGKAVDSGRYHKYIEPSFAGREPRELTVLDIQRLKRSLEKNLKPQTVKHVLNLLTWIINFGVKNGLCEGLSFQIKKPTVNNEVTEFLNDNQLRRLMEAIEADSNLHVAAMMKLALYTGMRRGELFNLEWSDVDFDQGFLYIRDPKGGPDQKIPLNEEARRVLEAHVRTESKYVFPGKNGNRRVSVQATVNRIKKRAGLPTDFRPMHGLRHAFASMMASSGKVDLYTLQKLLTHKDSRMTQRYAHLRDDVLKRASNVAGEIIGKAVRKKDNVVQINEKAK